MTQLHLDADEWEAIVEALQTERGLHSSEGQRNYYDYLTSIMLKIEIALDTPS